MQTKPRHSWRAKMKVGIGNPGSLSKTRQYLIEAQPYKEIKRERESTVCKWNLIVIQFVAHNKPSAH